MRVTYDGESDIARIYLSEEQQSRDDGATYLLAVQEDEREGRAPTRSPLFVQIAFKAYERLLWVQVHEASRALPEGLLRNARPERLSGDDETEPPPALGGPAR